MKTIHTLLCALAFAILLVSCSKDDEEEGPAPAPVTAQLFDDTGVMENSEMLEFRIAFNQPASTNGYIIVGVTSTNDEAFETVPATVDGEMEVPVTKGSRFATIQFSPQDNQVLEENELITFELLESSEGFIFGNKRTTTVEITDNEAPVSASFSSSSLGTAENSEEGVEVRINFSAAAPGTGNLFLELEGDNEGIYVETYPTLNAEKKILIPVTSGTLFTTFQVYPKDNSILEDHRTLRFRIVEADGVLVKGDPAAVEVVVLDDEIQGRIKSAETISDHGRSKRTWHYNPDGKIGFVNWEVEPAQLTSGTNHYHYTNDGRLQNISTFPGDGESFFWENGKVVLSEKISGFFKVGYSTYEYDTNGRIQKKTDYRIKVDGAFEPVTRYEFEYFADGNMKKQSTYIRANEAAWVLNARLEYTQYSDRVNPSPMEIVPTFSIQPHLPLMFSMRGDGVNLSHYYAYEYNADGKVTKRTTIGEITTYTYY